MMSWIDVYKRQADNYPTLRLSKKPGVFADTCFRHYLKSQPLWHCTFQKVGKNAAVAHVVCGFHEFPTNGFFDHMLDGELLLEIEIRARAVLNSQYLSLIHIFGGLRELSWIGQTTLSRQTNGLRLKSQSRLTNTQSRIKSPTRIKDSSFPNHTTFCPKRILLPNFRNVAMVFKGSAALAAVS